MNIEPVNNSGKLVSIQQDNKKAEGNAKNADSKKKTEHKDILELSSQAKSMNVIEAKLKSGFYNKPEVLKDVAEKLDKLIPQAQKD